MAQPNFEFVAVEPPSQPPPPPARTYKKVKWADITPYNASGTSKPAMNPRSVASDIPLDKLRISAQQRASLDDIYSSSNASADRAPVDHLFKLDPDDQLNAAAIMAQHGLDLEAREYLSNRDCGYDHSHFQSKQRHTPVPFNGCLAHAEITYVIGSEKILRIRGYFEHNQGCKNAVFNRIPPIPVHRSVFAVALAQLRDGATFTDIKKKNRELFAAQKYKDFPADLETSPYRWSQKPQINIDEWLDPASPQYNATLADAIFHYSARTNKTERFETCIATEEMRQTAWKYGHESQIIVDGTFGVCDSRLLLFIIMVVDENKKGIPVAFLLFPAPTGNRQSSAGYDTEILAKLIRTWQNTLTNCGHLYGFAGVIFSPFTAITDMDMKERGALIIVIPAIWLLICRFHLRQLWKNYRNKLLKGKGQLKIDLKHRLKRLEDLLVKTQDIEEARTLLATETNTLLLLGTSKTILRVVRHVKYLTEYWTTDNLWKSWSDYGRKVAAALLGCHMDAQTPTAVAKRQPSVTC
ncbi:hypothetical protein C8R44DRAFT_749621 [Mycena epipterygia]|nr:hypothetical protein C8R44DRAFT_749621 [Mycena epipterygia]